MSFTSITFLLYGLPICLILYYLIPERWKQPWLIVFSVLFYGWTNYHLAIFLMIMIAYTYGFGKWMHQTKEKKRQRLRLWIACGGLIFLLGYFKYMPSLMALVQSLQTQAISYESLIMPLGLSFLIFQALSYLVDGYRNQAPYDDIQSCALYLSFFPKLLMGPIEPYHRFVTHNATVSITIDGVEKGCRQFVLGLAQKLILADTFAQLYAASLNDMSVLGSWLSSIAYTLQIYFDFAGYSCMAIGIASILGYSLMENFDQPYTAHGIRDFWHRWHISLSQWFRDYVYIPLGGSRVPLAKQIRNLLLVWGLTGIWHGSSLNFVIWGLYYGILLLIERYVIPKSWQNASPFFTWLTTMLLVNFGWVIFSHVELSDMVLHLGAMLGVYADGLVSSQSLFYLVSNAGFLLLGIFACMPQLHERILMYVRRLAWYPWLEVLAYGGLLLLAFGFLIGASAQSFLYFQF